jgi:DHA1 family bicyclomycin/chloramphenicol resistance-like MFS transporter
MSKNRISTTIPQVNPRNLIILLGCLNGLMPFTTDMYLPAFPSMVRYFDTHIGQVTLSMSSFFLGACLGQLINGPLLDRFGRKNPMLIGLSVFMITSFGCALAPTIGLLIVFRFFQAIAISMCAVGSRAVVRDIFPVEQTAMIFSSLALIMGVAPIIAPSVGALVLLYFDWRGIFLLLVIFAAVLILALRLWLPQVKIADDQYSLHPAALLSNYRAVLRTPQFLSYTMVAALTSSALFAWISSSSYIFIQLLGVSEQQFGWVFAGTASCLILSNQLNRILLRSFSSAQIAFAAAIAQFGICLLLFLIIRYAFQVPTLLMGLCAFMLCLHLITPNAMALALRPFTENVGSATAMMGSIQMAASALTTVGLSYFQNDTAWPMVIAMALVVALNIGVQYWAQKGNLRKTEGLEIK